MGRVGVRGAENIIIVFIYMTQLLLLSWLLMLDGSFHLFYRSRVASFSLVWIMQIPQQQ